METSDLMCVCVCVCLCAGNVGTAVTCIVAIAVQYDGNLYTQYMVLEYRCLTDLLQGLPAAGQVKAPRVKILSMFPRSMLTRSDCLLEMSLWLLLTTE